MAESNSSSRKDSSFGSARRAGEGSDDERARFDALKVTLDECWDLLRQRRALTQQASTPT